MSTIQTLDQSQVNEVFQGYHLGIISSVCVCEPSLSIIWASTLLSNIWSLYEYLLSTSVYHLDIIVMAFIKYIINANFVYNLARQLIRHKFLALFSIFSYDLDVSTCKQEKCSRCRLIFCLYTFCHIDCILIWCNTVRYYLDLSRSFMRRIYEQARHPHCYNFWYLHNIVCIYISSCYLN